MVLPALAADTATAFCLQSIAEPLKVGMYQPAPSLCFRPVQNALEIRSLDRGRGLQRTADCKGVHSMVCNVVANTELPGKPVKGPEE